MMTLASFRFFGGGFAAIAIAGTFPPPEVTGTILLKVQMNAEARRARAAGGVLETAHVHVEETRLAARGGARPGCGGLKKWKVRFTKEKE